MMADAPYRRLIGGRRFELRMLRVYTSFPTDLSPPDRLTCPHLFLRFGMSSCIYPPNLKGIWGRNVLGHDVYVYRHSSFMFSHFCVWSCRSFCICGQGCQRPRLSLLGCRSSAVAALASAFARWIRAVCAHHWSGCCSRSWRRGLGRIFLRLHFLFGGGCCAL